MTKAELAAFIKQTIEDSVKAVKKDLDRLVEDGSNTYLTISEVASKFKVTKATIHNWINQGKLKKYKIQGRTLFLVGDINSAVNGMFSDPNEDIIKQHYKIIRK